MSGVGRAIGSETLLTVPEAANELSVSVRTLRTLISLGRISVVRVSSRRVAIDPRDIRSYIERQRKSAS